LTFKGDRKRKRGREKKNTSTPIQSLHAKKINKNPPPPPYSLNLQVYLLCAEAP